MHGGEIEALLVGLVVVLLAAKIGGHLALKFSQPEVLGELMIGVLLGNLGLLGLEFFSFLRHDHTLAILSELGVILLLFEVGLETNVSEMRKVGWSALFVAVLGVVVPFALGWAVSSYFQPNAHELAHVFVGATLCATSVGITARVLKDLGKLQTAEARIILGAAVIDDVLGLLVLAVVTAMIASANAGVEVAVGGIVANSAIAIGFVLGSVAVGSFISPKLYRLASNLHSHGVLLAVSLAICFGMSYLAVLVGLAPIVGAFTAGLILEPAHYKPLKERENSAEIDHLIKPITGLLVPIFFVGMGARVDLATFADTSLLAYAAGLTIAAIIGKQACSLGAMRKGTDSVAVGLGMIPRGEVGLIFAGIGLTLKIAGERVIDQSVFGAIVIMVIITTMCTPPLLTWRFKRGDSIGVKAA